jgi:protein phosphatase 1 regulatory subunit 7
MLMQVLDVSNNRISKVEHLQGLTQLEDLWLNDNQIPSLEGIEEALQDQVGG